MVVLSANKGIATVVIAVDNYNSNINVLLQDGSYSLIGWDTISKIEREITFLIPQDSNPLSKNYNLSVIRLCVMLRQYTGKTASHALN